MNGEEGLPQIVTHQPDSAPELPPTLAVLGSCITRDSFNSIFNPDHKTWFQVVAQANQMSLISLMAEPLEVTWEPADKLSDYDVWNVNEEFSKGFLTSLAETQPDYLVVDLFGDNHFGVVQTPTGTFVTDNRWKIHKTDWYRTLEEAGQLRHLSVHTDRDEYLTLWRDAVRRLREYLDAHSPRTVVVVNRGRNTDSLWIKGRPRPVRLNGRGGRSLDVPRANAVWAELDDEQTTLLRARQVDLTQFDFGTFDKHPWGPSWVHYQREYYPLFLGQLHRVHLEEQASAAHLARIACLDTAWRAQAEADRGRFDALSDRLTARNREVKQLRKQVAALEAQAQQPRGLRRVVRGLARRLGGER